MKTQFQATALRSRDGVAVPLATASNADKAADSVMGEICMAMCDLERSNGIAPDENMTVDEHASLQDALVRNGTLDLTEGSGQQVFDMTDERIAQLSRIMNTTYRIERLAA